MVRRLLAFAVPVALWSSGILLRAAEPASTQPADALKLSHIDSLSRSFNPSEGETAPIRIGLSKAAQVTVTIWGPNLELIAQPARQKSLPAGISTVLWDGRDVDGTTVPNEAYCFEVQAVAGNESTGWDPLLTSGGERVIAGDLDIPSETRITYELPKACRVLVRAAVEEGPLVRTVVNWEARSAGLALEDFDGWDNEHYRRIQDIPNVRFGVMAFALPDKVILTTGNSKLGYRRYFEDKAKLRKRKDKVIREQEPTTLISPHWLMPAHLNKDPRLTMRFSELDAQSTSPAGPPPTTQPTSAPASQPAATSAPAITPLRLTGNSALIRVDMPDADERGFMNNQKFELIIYLNDKRVLELEQGHVPFNYPWDISALSPGRYLLTVNVSSFRNHVGTISRYVEIAR